MAKKFAILLAMAPLAGCSSFGADSYGVDTYGLADTAKTVAVGGLVGGATNYVLGANVGAGAAVGAIASAGAQLLTN